MSSQSVSALGTRTIGIAASRPVGYTGTAADIAALVACLASGEPGFVTGRVSVIDGGRTCLPPAT